MAATAKRLARPGGKFLLWCFYSAQEELPLISFSGPSRLSSAIWPGEEAALFADSFDIERQAKPERGSRAACFLMTRKG